MNKAFITQSANTLTVDQFYWVLISSGSKANSDIVTKLDEYVEKDAVTQFNLVQTLTDLSYCHGLYTKLLEILVNVLDPEDGTEDPSGKQFSEWLPTSGLEAKINTLIELIPE